MSAAAPPPGFEDARLDQKDAKWITFMPRECKRFSNTKYCEHGTCTFLHIARHGRPFAMKKIKERPYLKACKFFLGGKCMKGSE